MSDGALAPLPGADQARRAACRAARPKLSTGRRTSGWASASRTAATARRIDDLRAHGRAGQVPLARAAARPAAELDLDGIDWVIVGGESGPGARPMDPAWVIDLRDQCRARRRAVLLQAVGRHEQEADRPHPRRAHVGRDAEGAHTIAEHNCSAFSQHPSRCPRTSRCRWALPREDPRVGPGRRLSRPAKHARRGRVCPRFRLPAPDGLM